MSERHYADFTLLVRVDNAVWKSSQRQPPETAGPSRTKPRMRTQEINCSLELGNKALAHRRASLRRVERGPVHEFGLR